MALISSVHHRKKLVELLDGDRNGGRILLIFNHGLGDLINFLPLYDEFKHLYGGKWRIELGGANERGFQYIIPEYRGMGNDNLRDLYRLYKHIVRLSYPEPDSQQKQSGIAKPYICNQMEIGIRDYEWKPWKNPNYAPLNSDSKRIGVHFFGNSNEGIKNPTKEDANQIWDEIKETGYEPFEIHQVHSFTFDKNLWHPSFIKENETLRYKKPNLGIMSQEIQKCKYFIGVDSGPLYLAGSILGFDNCIGIERYLNIAWYCPAVTNRVDIIYYKKGTIKSAIRKLDNGKTKQQKLSELSIQSSIGK
jgi:hypothetical protein